MKIPRGAAVRYRLGKKRGTWRPMWDFICVGHGEPDPVPFLGLIEFGQEGDPQDPRVSLKAGSHELELSLTSGEAELVSLTVTSDLGYVPKGITSFLAKRVRRK